MTKKAGFELLPVIALCVRGWKNAGAFGILVGIPLVRFALIEMSH